MFPTLILWKSQASRLIHISVWISLKLYTQFVWGCEAVNTKGIWILSNYSNILWTKFQIYDYKTCLSIYYG